MSEGDVAKAVEALSDASFPALVLLVAAATLATVLTQAFQFEAIQFLEGYWGPGRLRSLLANARCRRHVRRRNNYWDRMATLEREAFAQALLRMLERGVSTMTVEDVRQVKAAEVELDDLPADRKDAVEDHTWQDYAPVEKPRELRALSGAVRHYPAEDRAVLPTRLGNTLRAYEDEVEDTIGRDIQRFVQDVHHLLPTSCRRTMTISAAAWTSTAPWSWSSPSPQLSALFSSRASAPSRRSSLPPSRLRRQC